MSSARIHRSVVAAAVLSGAAALTVLPPVTPDAQAAGGCTSYQYGRGGSGTCVSYIQRMLNGMSANFGNMYYNESPQGKQLSVDGQWGDQTAYVVGVLQANVRDNNNQPLSRDGVIGPKSWEAMCRVVLTGTAGYSVWADARDAAQRAGC